MTFTLVIFVLGCDHFALVKLDLELDPVIVHVPSRGINDISKYHETKNSFCSVNMMLKMGGENSVFRQSPKMGKNKL